MLLLNLQVAQQHASVKPVLDEASIDEMRGVYPDAHMIDDLGDAPAYGLWARHVHRLTMLDVHVTPDAQDPRPEYVLNTDVSLC